MTNDCLRKKPDMRLKIKRKKYQTTPLLLFILKEQYQITTATFKENHQSKKDNLRLILKVPFSPCFQGYTGCKSDILMRISFILYFYHWEKIISNFKTLKYKSKDFKYRQSNPVLIIMTPQMFFLIIVGIKISNWKYFLNYFKMYFYFFDIGKTVKLTVNLRTTNN